MIYKVFERNIIKIRKRQEVKYGRRDLKFPIAPAARGERGGGGGHPKLIQDEGFKTKLLKYKPEGDKSTMGSFMVPFFASNSKKTGRDLIDRTIDSLIHAFYKQRL